MTSRAVTRQIRKRTLLVVDDDMSVVLGIGRNLIRKINIIPVCSASDAIQQLESRDDIDAIATDLRVPGMDGIQLLKYVKETFPKLKRILFTGHIDAAKVTEAISQVGVTAMMFKPLDTDELLEYARGTHPSLSGYEIDHDNVWR